MVTKLIFKLITHKQLENILISLFPRPLHLQKNSLRHMLILRLKSTTKKDPKRYD